MSDALGQLEAILDSARFRACPSCGEHSEIPPPPPADMEPPFLTVCPNCGQLVAASDNFASFRTLTRAERSDLDNWSGLKQAHDEIVRRLWG